MCTTRHRIAAAVSMLCLLFAVSGCSFGGGSAPKQVPTTFPARPQTGLASYLEPPPLGSRPGTSSWAQDSEPSTSTFLDHFYGTDAHTPVAKSLESQGLTGIAHVLWIANDLVEGDVVLMQFSTPDGPLSRLIGLQSASDADPKLASYSITRRGAPIVYYERTPDRQNNVAAKTYAVVGNVLVELFTFSPAEFSKGDLETWLRAQIARLP